MERLKSNFNAEFSNDELILIRDRSALEQTMSVTNDAENLVEFLYEMKLLKKDMELYYIDTSGRVDILKHDGNGKFTGYGLGFKDEDEFYNTKVRTEA